jgi:hypothetical protein
VGLLAEVARKRGARWIIPFDADEFWFAEDRSLRDFLGAQRCRTVEATGNHLYPPSGASVEGGDRIADEAELDLGTVGYRKIAFRASRNVFVYHGNHEVERRGARGSGLYIAHALEQLRRKVRNGAAAMKAAGSRRGKHWKHLARLSDADLETYWETVRERQEWGKVGWVPRGPLQRVSVRSARTWTDVLVGGPPGTGRGA